jgi:peptidoglycan/xylan/chitin deacetylase (PgdA/CDA1 family)
VGRHMDRRRFLAGVGLFTVGGAAGRGLAAELGFAAEGPTARTAAPSGPGEYTATVMFRASPSARFVALTIDDGPTREWTPWVLAILQRHGAKATFFRVGQRAQAAPDLVMQTADAGHEQGNHTWSHDDLTQHGAAFAHGSLERTHQLLAELTGRPPTLCRPPYGRIDSVGLAVCAGLRYGVTLWSQHVTGGRPRGDVDTILRRGSPGSIVLAHDGGREPNVSLMTQLDRLVASMTDRGYRFVTVSELLSASVQGGVNHSRLHRQFRLAGPERLHEAIWQDPGSDLIQQRLEQVVIGPVHDRDVDIRPAQGTGRPDPAEPAADDDYTVTSLAHENSISGRGFPVTAARNPAPVRCAPYRSVRLHLRMLPIGACDLARCSHGRRRPERRPWCRCRCRCISSIRPASGRWPARSLA